MYGIIKSLFSVIIIITLAIFFNGCSWQVDREQLKSGAYSVLDSLLQHDNPLEQDRVLNILKTIHTLRSHEMLSDFVKEPGSLQINAAFSLAVHRDSSVYERIVAVIDTSNWLIQQNAIYSLRFFPIEKVFPVFERCLNDRSMQCRMAAIRALDNLNDPSVLPLLQKAATDSLFDVQKSAVLAILDLPGSVGINYVKEQLRLPDKDRVTKIISILAAAPDSIAMPLLIPLAESQDNIFRRFLAARLEVRNDAGSITCLKTLIKDPDEFVRTRALLSLISLREADNTLDFVQILKNPKAPLFWDALRIATELGDKEYYSVIEELYKSEKEPKNKIIFGVTLLRYNDTRAENLINEMIQNQNMLNILDVALNAFMYVHNDLCVPFLIKASQIEHSILKDRALRALSSFENEDTINYFNKISTEENIFYQRHALEYFGKLAKKDKNAGTQFILNSFNNSNAVIRERTAFISGDLHLEKALKPLWEHLFDQEIFVRMACAWAILNILENASK